MDKNPLYPIGCETYLNPERQRKSGTHATIDWDYRNPFESDLGRVIFCPAIRRMHEQDTGNPFDKW